jgi:hypothetical protein
VTSRTERYPDRHVHFRLPPVRTLLVAASLAVFVLLMLSDFKPIQVVSFSETSSGGGRFKISCVVIDSGTSQKGWVLTLRDCAGNEVGAFLNRELSYEPPATGAIVEIIGEVAEDDPSFVFIESLKVIAPSQTPSSSNGKS